MNDLGSLQRTPADVGILVQRDLHHAPVEKSLQVALWISFLSKNDLANVAIWTNARQDRKTMRLPQRRSQMMVKHGPETDHLTEESVNRLKKTLYELENVERPKIVVDLAHAITLGDFSENAEYQDAKARLARIDGRIFGMKERIKNAIVIASGSSDGMVGLGSTVDVIMNGKQKTYRILGPQEADPSKGRISHLSPLGSALMGKSAGDIVSYITPDGAPSTVEIISIV